VTVHLWPLTRRERLGLGRAGRWTELLAARDGDWPALLREDDTPAEDWRDAAKLGGYPVPVHALDDPAARSLWFAGYTQTYLERDLRQLSAVGSLPDFRRLMRAACLRLGNLVNQTELGRDVGLSQPTVHRHLGLLEASFQLVRLSSHAANRTKRVVKTPKLYWCDSALALHLAGETEPRGAHLENLVLADLLAWTGAVPDGPALHFWRTTAGAEVDFVIESGRELLPVEVKTSRRVRLADADGIRAFQDEHPAASRAGLLLHAGDELGWLADRVLAVPWWRVI
jgi:hypothetical protein